MPSVNKTANYGLNQWQGNEYPKRVDFNEDNEIIDQALKDNADAIEAANDSISNKIDKATFASDANTLGSAGEVTFHQSIASTVNTPYSQGLVVSQSALIMTYKAVATAGVQWYFMTSTSGNIPRVFFRALTTGVWGPWTDIMQNSIAYGNVGVYVSPTGNDVTGDGSSGNPYKTWGKAISTIPHNLNGYYASLNIADGVYPEDVTFSGFFGGRIILNLGSNVTVNSITSDSFTFIDFYSSSTLNVGWLYALRHGVLFFGSNVTVNITGSSTLAGLSNVSCCGLAGGHIYMSGNVNISNNTGTCVFCTGNKSEVYLGTLTGSNNTGIGLRASAGVIKYGSNSLSVTTATSTNAGGRILSGAQTNIPNY